MNFVEKGKGFVSVIFNSGETINEWWETMSKAHQDIKVENLIAEYRELSDSWNGKCLKTEKKMQDIAGELEDYGIMVEDLD